MFDIKRKKKKPHAGNGNGTSGLGTEAIQNPCIDEVMRKIDAALTGEARERRIREEAKRCGCFG